MLLVEEFDHFLIMAFARRIGKRRCVTVVIDELGSEGDGWGDRGNRHNQHN